MCARDPELPLATLEAALDRFFGARSAATSRPSAARRPIVVAFSGGPDSLALLLACRRPARRHGLRLVAAHVDHGLDAESGTRAAHARDLARALDVDWILRRLDPKSLLDRPGSLEAHAREARYSALEGVRARRDAGMILTAHHADDQAETVILRLLGGSGWRGLAGIAPCWGHVRRPLLDHSRSMLAAVVAASRLVANDDPGNLDPRFARTATRHRLLPALRAQDPAIDRRLATVAALARRARRRLDRCLTHRLGIEREPGRFGCADAWSLNREALRAHPASLRHAALDVLAARAGRPFGPGRGVRRALAAQLEGAAAIGVDAGGGWRFEGDGRRLRLMKPAAAPPRFVYDLNVPGRVWIRPLGCVLESRIGDVEAWMFRAQHRRAALSLPRLQRAGVAAFAVRNRRPGDRFRPLGCAGRRRLKDVLIDRHVPRHLRDRLPLVVVDDQVAWIPGVGIDHRFRIRPDATRAVAIEIQENRNL